MLRYLPSIYETRSNTYQSKLGIERSKCERSTCFRALGVVQFCTSVESRFLVGLLISGLIISITA